MQRFLIAFVAFMYAAMLWPLIRSRIARGRWLVLWRRFRLRDLPLAFATFITVAGVGGLLYQTVEFTRWSWLSLVGGSGSLATGNIASSSPSQGLTLFLMSLFCFGAFAFLLPVLAHVEERWFRRGAEGRGVLKNVAWAASFGLSHALIGVPLAFALALGLLGLVCTNRYLSGHFRGQSRASAMRSAVSFHLTYNVTVVMTLVVVIGIVSIFRSHPPA